MTVLNGHWSFYAALNGFTYTQGGSATPQPTSFYAALYSNTADPDGGSPIEVTDAGYSRVTGVTMTNNDSIPSFISDFSIDFGPFVSATAVGGVALVDAGTDEILWWANLPTPQTLPPGTGVSIPGGQFTVQENL